VRAAWVRAKPSSSARKGAKVVVADVLGVEARQVVEEDRRGRRPSAVREARRDEQADWENAVKITVTAFGKLDPW